MHVLYISAHEKDFVFENAGRNQIILQEKTMNSNKIDRKEIQSSGIRLRFASNSSRGGAGVGAMDTGNADLGSSEPCRVRPSRRAVEAISISLEM